MALRASVSIQFSELEYRDSEQLGELYKGPDIKYLRREAGPFRSHVRKAVLGDLALYSNHHISSMVVEGSNQSDLVAIGFIGPDCKARRVMGEVFTNQHVYLFGPRVEHMATVVPGQTAYIILIPQSVLAETIASQLNRDHIPFANRRYILNIGRSKVGELIRLVERRLTAASEKLDVPIAPQELIHLQKNLVECVASVLTSTGDDLFRESDSRLSAEKILARSQAFFDENFSQPLGLSDICREVGVGQRKLQLVFAEGLGLSPMRYLKLRRLGYVREQLLASGGTPPLIKQVARRAGFTHMGKFTQEYKRLFGESATETLQKLAGRSYE
jgi:AraC-like DNA-binding protein